MTIETTAETIRPYVEAHYNIIYIEAFDELLADEVIKKIANTKKIYEYNAVSGISNFETKQPEVANTTDIVAALSFFNKNIDSLDDSFLVLKDIHKRLEEHAVVSQIKMLANQIWADENIAATIFIIAPRLVIAPEIEKLMAIFNIGLPSFKEIQGLLNTFSDEQGITIEKETQAFLSEALKGLSLREIRHLLNLALQNDGEINMEDYPLILKEKEQVVKKSGILELVTVKEKFEDIGGLRKLKDWLEIKAVVFKQLEKAQKFGVEIPKGVLVAGMPGCGKSLSAKACASLFELPLLRLDMGRLLGKYVGESEGNMRRAIALAEAISPCILWVDEVEKAFSGIGSGGSGSEVATRLFGYFLTWMQEKDSPVFVIATANDISNLPPELLRKGRFDEIFYVDFPSELERKAIFELHLAKRNQKSSSIQVDVLAKESDGFSGADIESVVKESVEQAFVQNKNNVTMDDLKQILKDTTSLSETLKDKIEEYKTKFKKLKIKSAS